MKKKHFSIFGIFILCILIFSDVNAQSSVDNKESARIFVQKFYDWYFVLSSTSSDLKNKASRPDDIIAINQKGAYFDTPLRNALIEDDRAQSKAKGELVGLDFDPFLNAQDTRSGAQTGNVKQTGDKFFVDIHDIKQGKSKTAILAAELFAIAEVAKTDGHWVFTNFIYPSPKGQHDLLSILVALHKDRDKTAK